MVLITHHLEEIPPGFTHALVLKAGRVLAQGPVGDVVTSAVLSDAFALNLTVNETNGRYSAVLAT